MADAETSYDLTLRMAPFLDKHLLLNLLDFLQESDQQVYKKEDLANAELKLVLSTEMIGLAEDKYKALGMEVPEELEDRKAEVMDKLEETKDFELSLLQKLENQAELDKMAECKSLDEVCGRLDVSFEQVEGLVAYAKLLYESGDYKTSSLLLNYYRKMRIRTKEDGRTKEEETSKTAVTLWGVVAALLLVAQNDEKEAESAADNIDILMNYLDTNMKLTRKEVLVQKTWLLHWSLWAMFKFETVPFKVLNIFISEKSLSIVSLSCPHLLRYVAAALVLQKRLKLEVKDKVSVIHAETHAYNDPITRFLVALFIDLDFKLAQQELKQCEAVCKIDFFLADQWELFEENARLMIFETYCQIHQCIYIAYIAENLNMTPEEAELWIVKLIQSARLDARIDSEKSRVVMSKAPPSVYQQVIEKTKNLSFRSTMLLSNLEKKEQKELAKS